MNHISNVGNHVSPEQVKQVQSDVQGKREAAQEPVAPPRQDEAQISDLGRLLSIAEDQADIRAEKVAHVKLALEQDEQKFIRDRIGLTIERLVQDLQID